MCVVGQVPQRFGNDTEVMKSFKEFQMTCASSAQEAQKLQKEKMGKGKKERRFLPKDGPLQTTGPLDRKFVMTFTRKVASPPALLPPSPEATHLSHLSRMHTRRSHP